MPASPLSQAASAAREILTRLHDVMAARTAPQSKLNQVVGIIGEALSSEVCSIYLRRDGVLELFATRGLKQEAVHVTKLAMGEGLVGIIAERSEILNLAEAGSILSLMILCATLNASVVIEANGDDEQEAVKAVAACFEPGGPGSAV